MISVHVRPLWSHPTTHPTQQMLANRVDVVRAKNKLQKQAIDREQLGTRFNDISHRLTCTNQRMDA